MQLNSTKRITFNASSAVIQVIVIGIVYFFLYRFLITKLGANLLGLWSLIVATSSIANIANFGITSSLVKFVADKNANNETENLGKLIFTALISITILYTILAIFILLCAPLIIGMIVDIKYIDIALKLLPYSLSCLLINSIGGVFTSTLEGIQKNYLRNFIYIITSVIFLFSTFALVPRFGIIGVAIAQNIQGGIILIYTFLQTKQNIPSFRLRKWNWDRIEFFSMLNYGYKFQLISIMQLIVDPITRALLSKFGGLAMLAYYEMAYRLVAQVRSVIINAYQVTIPVIAHFNQTQKSSLKSFYIKTFPFVLTSSVIAISALIFFSGLLSRFWIGHYEIVFVNYSIIIATGILVNILGAPAYFNYIGIGNINLLVIVQFIDALLNVILCFILSSFFPTYGVVFSWSISAILGAIIVIVNFHGKNNISLADLIKKNNLMLLLIGSAILLTSTLLYNNDRFIAYFNSQNKYTELIIMVILFFSIFAINILKNQHFNLYKSKTFNLLSILHLTSIIKLFTFKKT